MATTRRAFVTASVAPLASAPAALALASEADTRLQTLARTYQEADEAFHAAYDAWNAATTLYGKRLPEPPKALFARGKDFGLNIPDSVRYGEGRFWYGRDNIIEELRTQPRTRQDWSNTTEVLEEDGTTALQCSYAPWPEAQARAEEILAAWDEWEVTKQHTAEAAGLDEAEERKDETREQVFEAFTAIMDTPATSLAGLLVKAEVALSLSHSVDGFSAYVDEFHENNGHSPETIGLAVLRDLLRLKGEAV